MTSKVYWGIYGKRGIFFKVESHLDDIESVPESFGGTDHIFDELSCLILGAMVVDTPVLDQSNNTVKKKRYDEDMYCTVGAVKAKSLLSLIPEKLISM